MFFVMGLYGQTPFKGGSVFHFRGVPLIANFPIDTATASEISLNVLNGRLYTINRDSNDWKLETFITQGSGIPVGDPGINPRTYLDKASGWFYRWNGSAWALYTSTNWATANQALDANRLHTSGLFTYEVDGTANMRWGDIGSNGNDLTWTISDSDRSVTIAGTGVNKMIYEQDLNKLSITDADGLSNDFIQYIQSSIIKMEKFNADSTRNIATSTLSNGGIVIEDEEGPAEFRANSRIDNGFSKLQLSTFDGTLSSKTSLSVGDTITHIEFMDNNTVVGGIEVTNAGSNQSKFKIFTNSFNTPAFVIDDSDNFIWEGYPNTRDDSGTETPRAIPYTDVNKNVYMAPIENFDVGGNPFGGDSSLDGVIDSLHANSGGSDGNGIYSGSGNLNQVSDVTVGSSGRLDFALPTASGVTGTGIRMTTGYSSDDAITRYFSLVGASNDSLTFTNFDGQFFLTAFDANTFNITGNGGLLFNSGVSIDSEGLLRPRALTTTQRNALSGPILTGSLIYNTDSLHLEHYNGTAWQGMGSGSADSDWTVDGDTLVASVDNIRIGGTSMATAQTFLQSEDQLYFFKDGFSGVTNYFFGDIAAWSAAHGGGAYNTSNNFHPWWSVASDVRAEFENNLGPLQFYIEGIGEAWYGLQDGSTHLWSFGFDTGVDGNTLNFNNGFGLDASPQMSLTTDGKLYAQSDFIVGSSTFDASAALNVVSTSKGILIPRMNTGQKNGISSPATSLLVFDTDLDEFQYYNGTAWTGLGGSYSPPNVATPTVATSTSIDLSNDHTGIIDLDFSSIGVGVTLSLSNPVNGGEYKFWFEGCNNDTIVFPDNFLSRDRDSLKTRLCTTNEIMSFFYDGTNYITSDTIWAPASTAAPGDSLLDNYSGAIAAYSLRYLLESYTGDVIRVRRSSDDSEQDFNPTEIGDGTLTTFVGGGNDGFVVTWYDQTGNSNDATQATDANQPKIVDAGSVVTENGEHAVDFDGSDRLSASRLLSADTWSMFAVAATDKTTLDGTTQTITCQHTGSADAGRTVFQQIRNISGTSGYTTFFNNGSSHVGTYTASLTANQVLFTSIAHTDDYYIGMDGGSLEEVISNESLTPLNTNFSIGAFGDDLSGFDGTMQEIVIYNSNKTSDKTGIETNINDYYSIY